jgi:hypothetical protein
MVASKKQQNEEQMGLEERPWSLRKSLRNWSNLLQKILNMPWPAENKKASATPRGCGR